MGLGEEGSEGGAHGCAQGGAVGGILDDRAGWMCQWVGLGEFDLEDCGRREEGAIPINSTNER